MSDEEIRFLERQVMAQPADQFLRQQLLHAYLRGGVATKTLIEDLAILGDEAAFSLIGRKIGSDSRTKRFYIACSLPSYRIAYTRWVEFLDQQDNVQHTDTLLAEAASFLIPLAESFIAGQGLSQTFDFSGFVVGERISLAMLGTVLEQWYAASDEAGRQLQIAAMHLQRSLSSKLVMINTRLCIIQAANVLSHFENLELRERAIRAEQLFEATKPEISRLLLPAYLPPPEYLTTSLLT